MIPEYLTPYTIWVSRPQQKIIRPALCWIMKHDSPGNWTDALGLCCAYVFDNYILDSSWPRIVIPTDGPTKPFRFLRGSHPMDTTDAAIGIANEEIGLNDEGAALTHIAATFILTWPEIATSPSRKMRALRRRLYELHLRAKAEQGGEQT